MTHFRYVGMRKAYTKGLATELKDDNQTPKIEIKFQTFSPLVFLQHLMEFFLNGAEFLSGGSKGGTGTRLPQNVFIFMQLSGESVK